MFNKRIVTKMADQLIEEAKTINCNEKHAYSTHIDYKKRIKLFRNELKVGEHNGRQI